MELRRELQSWPAQIDGSGRLLIPAESRQAMGWSRGTDVVIESDGDSLRVLTLDQFTKEVQHLCDETQPGEPMWSDQLLSERRVDAQREVGAVAGASA